MSNFPYTLSDKTCTVLIDGRPHQTDRTNANWDRIKEALNDPNTTAEQLRNLMTPVHAVINATQGHTSITVQNGKVYYGSEEVNNVLAARILDIVTEGLDVDPWVKFAENVYANPASWSRDELYLFLEKADLPITPDGCFIAYKIVTEDYKDCYTGTIDNSIGKIVSMRRESVDPNRHNTCSVGLHFCSKSYLPHYGVGSGGRKVVLVKINPADVVSIPSDYNNAKGRTWRYEVVGEIPTEEAMNRSWAPIAPSYSDPTTGETHRWGYDPDEVVPDDDENVVLPDFAWMSDETDEPEVAEQEPEAEETKETAVERIVIETVAHGKIDQKKFMKLLKKHKTLRGIAIHLGVSSGTVQSWKTKLFGKAN